MGKGFFCVIEGQDGAGVGTQAEILREKFMTKQSILFLRYPDYNTNIGMMIHEFLHGKVIFPKEIVFLLYAIDQLKDKEKIEEALRNGRIVLADRYFTSDLVYQCIENLELEKALKFAEVFNVPIPDLVIFLKISPEIGIQRKIKEKGKGDIYERDIEFQRKVGQMYEKLAKEKIFAKEWVIVDGEKSIEDVAKEIENIVFSRLKSD